MRHEQQLIQEIKDLFARNSGDYMPTDMELENIDEGLEELFCLEPPAPKLHLEQLDAKRIVAERDKADLFDFYHENFYEVLKELKAHRDYHTQRKALLG